MKTEQEIRTILQNKEKQLLELKREIREEIPIASWYMNEAYMDKDILVAEILLLKKILEIT